MKTASKKRALANKAKPATAKNQKKEPKEIGQPNPEGETNGASKPIVRKFDAVPDSVDLRDWTYQPALISLPDQLINCDLVPEILDQGADGACTGFALAAVINFLRRKRNRFDGSVSSQMLYDLARHYDEWPGEKYEGSSARGAMKGWAAHGVCSLAAWPVEKKKNAKADKKTDKFTPTVLEEARLTPGGAYYRVMHRQIRDMHVALEETGILYVTLMVHDGWSNPGPRTVPLTYADAQRNIRERNLPVIQRSGRADSGHAVAIVGYTNEGFIIQNSWGKGWGAGGFALLPYEDYMLHATDVWVVQLGVPVNVNLWEEMGVSTQGIHRAAAEIPLDEIRPYVVDLGHNGKLSDSGVYWSTEADVEKIFNEHIPNEVTKRNWAKPRIMLYLHGGLNDERAVARRIIAYRDVFLENGIYPLHIMWETGVMESLYSILRSVLAPSERAGGAADWLRKFRDGLTDAKDWTIERSVGPPGTGLWNVMKRNANLASNGSEGGMRLIADKARKAVATLTDAARKNWELHVVGHSAGSIFAAHAIEHLVSSGIPFKSLSFMAPAITTELFKNTILKQINANKCPLPSMFVLSDDLERADQVFRVYGKSLLFLVSNAFEEQRATPLLGMERYISDKADASKDCADPDLVKLFKGNIDGRPSLVVSGRAGQNAGKSQSRSHGGFDNDPDTLNSIIWRMLGSAPIRPFQERDLNYDKSGTAAGSAASPNEQEAVFSVFRNLVVDSDTLK